MKDKLPYFLDCLASHLALTMAALALGVLVCVPLGVAMSRVRWLSRPVLGVASVAQTIPVLALMAFMVPALAAVGAPSIGYLPALIGLFLYGLLPILRNTLVGLAGVDPSLIEAARGVGMTPGEQLRKVELPLALPVIVAGVRTAAVATAGTATLATLVGARSLGDYIFSGLQTRNYGSILIGCVASAALALLLDGAVYLVQLGAERRRPLFAALAAATLALCAAPAAVHALHDTRPAVTVGAEGFTEQYVLSRIVRGEIARTTGLPVNVVDSLGTLVAFDALRTNQIDVWVAYSGNLWTLIPLDGEQPRDRDQLLGAVKKALADRYGIGIAAVLGFENRYVLSMRRADAAKNGLRTVSDLHRLDGTLRLGADIELFHRPAWADFERTYHLTWRERRSMDPSLMYEAAKSGAVDVITAFSTDPRITSYGLVPLDDDQHAFPRYDAVILVSPRLQTTHPEVVAALRKLDGTLSEVEMQRLNGEVDEKGRTPEQAAEGFLRGLR